MGLFDRFRSRPALSPDDWPARLEQAQVLAEGRHYRAAIALLLPLTGEAHPAATVLPLMPFALAQLGECYFQSAQPDLAVAPTRRALELARGQGSVEDQLAWLGNLYEIHRYLGEGALASDCAEEMASLLGGLGQASRADRYRRQAALVRRGEPAVRVVVEQEGERYEVEEILAGRAGAVRFLLERNRLTLRPAAARVAEAAGLANQGRFPDALTLLEEAAAVDAFDPEPHLRAGLMLTYLERYGEAVEALAACEERAPGWGLCRPARWLAEQLERGAVSHDAFVAWHALEEGPLPAEAKRSLVEQALRQAPGLALLHLHHGKILAGPGGASLASAAFRRGLELTEQADVRTRLLVELARVVEGEGEKRRLLGQAIEVGGDLIAVATARVVLALG